MKNYEKIKHSDPSFLVTFHDEKLTENTTGFYLHWHEHIEILTVTSGIATVTVNNAQITAKTGDTVVINSNDLHAIFGKDADCRYHCLILDRLFCDSFGIPLDKLRFEERISDERIVKIMTKIALQMKKKESYYKALVQGLSVELLVLLAREYTAEFKQTSEKNSGMQITRRAISYISQNYKENITIDDIAENIGFSKYYFCHAFKETTGQTVVEYINSMRCNEARRLISSERYNVNESAFASGFNNLSYFSRTYKKLFGVSPSDDMNQTKGR